MSDPSPSGYHASDGAAYDRFLGRWTERLAPLLVDFARLPDDGEVLDVGCGTGNLAAEVARRESNRAVTGADLSESYLAFARARHGTLNAHFQHCDAAELPFASGKFGASLAQLVLTFVPNPNKVVAQMARVTRRGGVVAAAVWDFCGGSTCGERTRSMRRGSITMSLAPWRSRFFMRLANTGCPSVGLAPITMTTSACSTESKSCVPAKVPNAVLRP